MIGEITQQVRHLLYKHEDLSLDLQNPFKKPEHTTTAPATQRQADPGLPGQPTKLKWQTPSPEILIQKKRGG